MTSFNLNYILKALSSNIVTLGVRTSSFVFGGEQLSVHNGEFGKRHSTFCHHPRRREPFFGCSSYRPVPQDREQSGEGRAALLAAKERCRHLTNALHGWASPRSSSHQVLTLTVFPWCSGDSKLPLSVPKHTTLFLSSLPLFAQSWLPTTPSQLPVLFSLFQPRAPISFLLSHLPQSSSLEHLPKCLAGGRDPLPCFHSLRVNIHTHTHCHATPPAPPPCTSLTAL